MAEKTGGHEVEKACETPTLAAPQKGDCSSKPASACGSVVWQLLLMEKYKQV